MLVVAKGRIGALLVHLSLRFHLDLQEHDREGSQIKNMTGEEEQNWRTVKADMERALAALDVLVFELSLFGTEEEEEEEEEEDDDDEGKGKSKGESKSQSENEIKAGKEEDVVEISADGTFHFDEAANPSEEPRKLSTRDSKKQHAVAEQKNKNKSKTAREAKGNHVDMSAIAENLLSGADAVYGIHDGVRKSRKLCKCEICAEVLVNRSFTVACGHSFHPTCIVGCIGEKLMNGLSPTCPVCFKGMEQ
jgi:hypothetical protein